MSKTINKKDKLIDSAGKLFHQAGFNQTSLADIAEDSGVPLGNVYYYFQSKDDLVAAVIDKRLEEIKTLVKKCEEKLDPKERLTLFIKYVQKQKNRTTKYGCPVGSLCQELDKENTPVSQKADALIQYQLQWVTEQFRAMGQKDSKKLGVHFITAFQGAAIVASAMKDCKIVDWEAQRLQSWIKAL